MRKIQDTSIHVAIHSVLQGDHALTEKVKLLNPSLIDNPNFQDVLENELRYSVFASKRKWIADTLSINTGMTVQLVSFKEAMELSSPFDKVSMKELVKAYMTTKKGFKLKGIKKTKKDVEYVHKLMRHLVDNPTSSLFHKTLVKDKRVMDGTHRLIAYLWAKKAKKQVPEALQMFHWL